MKVLGLPLGFLIAASLTVSAQVTVEVTQDQDQFLPGETMIAAVRITNRSGRSLRLGREQDWLRFSVQAAGQQVVAKTGEVPVEGEFVLESSRVATKRVDLQPYFSAYQPGRYSIIATVKVKDLNEEIASPPRYFDIIEGTRLWEQAVGIPNTGAATNSIPEVRKFILQQANYLKAQLRLYIRLTDESGARTYRVFPVGRMVSFGRPEPQVDKYSNMHLLYQDGAHSFSYLVVDPDGVIIARRTYDYLDRRPRLQPDEDGKVLVVGGQRRISSTDVPPSNPSDAAGEKPKPIQAPGEMLPLAH
jgi:hypothetical protein